MLRIVRTDRLAGLLRLQRVVVGVDLVVVAHRPERVRAAHHQAAGRRLHQNAHVVLAGFLRAPTKIEHTITELWRRVGGR